MGMIQHWAASGWSDVMLFCIVVGVMDAVLCNVLSIVYNKTHWVFLVLLGLVGLPLIPCECILHWHE